MWCFHRKISLHVMFPQKMSPYDSFTKKRLHVTFSQKKNDYLWRYRKKKTPSCESFTNKRLHETIDISFIDLNKFLKNTFFCIQFMRLSDLFQNFINKLPFKISFVYNNWILIDKIFKFRTFKSFCWQIIMYQRNLRYF